MSIVACRVTRDTIYLASDSQTTCAQDKRPGLRFKKIRKTDELIWCAVGACFEVQLLDTYIQEHGFPKASKDIILYMGEFYKWRDTVSDRISPEDKTRISNCTYMFVIKGGVYLVSDLFVNKITGFHSIGCGEDLAMGAMEHGATVTEAVEIACKYNIDCGLPVELMEIKRR
jgi:hypothetical protein